MDTVYDPLRKKDVAATPEEAVRQWFISLLLNHFKVPSHMMMSELGFRFGAKQYRADIVVYDRQARPLMIVECKRPEVALDEQVVNQAMRYNMVLGVRFLVLTNGSSTMVFVREEECFVKISTLPAYEEMLCGR